MASCRRSSSGSSPPSQPQPEPRTLHVPSVYRSIQAAIDAARDGDTVLVAPGTYAGGFQFAGKAIAVRSSGGAALTTITNGSVMFYTAEGPKSVLEGFSITGGEYNLGGAIHCTRASPTLINNVIKGNVGDLGGGIYCQGGAPLIAGNRIDSNRGRWGGGIFLGESSATIRNNVIIANVAFEFGGTIGIGRGGGIAAVAGTPQIENNLIADNQAGGAGFRGGWGEGGGLYLSEGTMVLANNTICRNVLQETPYVGRGAGLYAEIGTFTVRNCILWQNLGGTGEVHGNPDVGYSCVTGGFSGTGNISADPLFVDPNRLDLHLRHDSPCRDHGTSTGVALPATDFEGDPRIADGRVDMGADEFFPHLYHLGEPKPGGSIDLRLIGAAATQTLWAYSFHTLNPPASIPELNGLLHLDPSNMTIFPLGAMPSAGFVTLPYQFEPGFPPMTVFVQALVGNQLTNLDVLNVR